MVDTHGSYAFGFLHVSKQPEAAVAVLHNDVLPFYEALDFRLTYRQDRPYPCLGVTRDDGFDLQFFGLPGYDVENSLFSVIVAVPDTQALYDEFAAGLRTAYGKLPIAGLPRITRPRRKQGAGAGFSVIDPAGNWLRISAVIGMSSRSAAQTSGDVRCSGLSASRGRPC